MNTQNSIYQTNNFTMDTFTKYGDTCIDNYEIWIF